MANACKDMRPLIQAALDGELAAADRRGLDAHVAACPSCAGELGAGRLAIASLASLAAPEPGPGFATAVARGIAVAQTRRTRVQSRLSWAATAGTCLISAALVGAWRVVSSAIWDAASEWAWGVARIVAPLANVLGDAAITLGRGLMPIGGVAAKLSWLGFGWLATWYVLALGALLLVVIATRGGRRLTRFPAFSL
jgi:anti-sigma factor RsiW